MSALAIPEGLEPLGVWDVDDPEGLWRCGQLAGPDLMVEASSWALHHIERAVDVFRAEFYLIDAPLAVLYRHARDEDGTLRWNPETRRPCDEEPVIVPLAELPPAHLLNPDGHHPGKEGDHPA